MADNVRLSLGTADGATIATDDIGGVHYPIGKLAHGALDSATLVSTASGLPVQQQGTWTVQPGNTANTTAWKVDASSAAVPITDNAGSITVDNGGTFAVQATEADGANATLGAKADAKSTATDTTAVSLMSVAKQISASAQATAASVAGTLAVSGPLTDTQLRASAVPVSLASAPTTAVTLAAGASAIAKAEDVASADGDVGVPAMARRTATPANTSGTDLDYEMLQMNAGRLWASATIDAALPAGTNAIGKLAANSGVTIGAVEIAASQTLGTVTSLTQMNGAAIAMGTGVRSAGTQRVTIATDDVVPSSQSGTWTVTANRGAVSASTDVSLASAATTAQLLAANAARKGLQLTNTDANTAYLYYGTTATLTKFSVAIPPNYYWEMPEPVYTGRIDAIWAADGSGSLIGSEL